MCNSCKKLTHQISLNFGKKNFGPQTPHGTTNSQPSTWPRGPNENPIWYVIYLSFVRRYTKFGLKIFEIDCNSDLMIFYLLAPPQGPRGRGPKNGAVAYAFHVRNSHTKSGWILEKKKFDHATPQSTPKSHPWGMTQAAKWKSRLICFISFICEETHKVWFKNLWNWLSIWNLMIFNDIWPFGPSPGPQGAGPNKCAVAHPIHVSNSHTKFGWISSNGLGGDSVMDGRTEAIAISSRLF